MFVCVCKSKAEPWNLIVLSSTNKCSKIYTDSVHNNKVSLIAINWCMQNTTISKNGTKRGCLSYGYKLYNWVGLCRNTRERCARVGSEQDIVAPASLLSIWREHFLLAIIHNP